MATVAKWFAEKHVDDYVCVNSGTRDTDLFFRDEIEQTWVKQSVMHDTCRFREDMTIMLDTLETQAQDRLEELRDQHGGTETQKEKRKIRRDMGRVQHALDWRKRHSVHSFISGVMRCLDIYLPVVDTIPCN